MLNSKALILLVVVVSNLALIPLASANEQLSSSSITAEFSTSVGGRSESTTTASSSTKGEHANTIDSNNGGSNHSSAHSSANSTVAASPSVPASGTTSPPSSAPQNVKSKAVETGPSITKAPTGGLLARIGSEIAAAAKPAFSTESPTSTSTKSASKTLDSGAADELPLTKSTTGEEHDANEPLHKFCIYMKPVCDSIDHILPKQMTRLQSQFKQFVQLTDGRLSSCFLEQYFFDPAAKPVTKTDLSVICSSKSANSGAADNYRSFQSCAIKNWDPQVDKELDKIAAARLNCTKMHHHAPDAANAAICLSQDDDDEFNMFNDVVKKSLHAEKSSNSTSSETKAQQHSTSDSSEGLMGKVHSVLTGSSDGSNLSHPTTSKPNGQMSTKAPLLVSTQAPTKQSASLVDKLLGGDSTTKPSPSSPSTTKPPTSQLSPIESRHPASVAPSISIRDPDKIDTKSSRAPVVEATTVKVTTSEPSKLITKSTTSAAYVVARSSSKPPIKLLETLEQVLKRQEREKQQLDDKLRAEREKLLKQLQKKQDEIDAQNAIRALQMQRQSSSAASDQRLHRLEHQRQMAIDPIGHTIKHHQYELGKQQKANGK